MEYRKKITALHSKIFFENTRVKTAWAMVKISLAMIGFFLAFASHAQTLIYPNNSKLHYEGRIDFSNPKVPVFIWSGASVKMKFSGTGVSLILKDMASGGDASTNYYSIILDTTSVTTLEVNNRDSLYTLASGLVNKIHVIEIFKRTEAAVGVSAFKGFIVKGSILPVSAISNRKIEIIGDSWSCGYGNEKNYPDPNCCPGFHSLNEDNYTSYCAILARRLDAQYTCTAYSGRGMYRNYNGATTGTLPQLYSEVYPDQTKPLWNYNNYIPDLIIVFLGTNDFAGEAPGGSGLALDSAAYVKASIDFIKHLKNSYPKVTIVMLYGGSVTDNYPGGKHWLTRWRNYVTTVKNNFLIDDKVLKFELTPQSGPYGEDWHPSKATHISIAKQLAPFLQKTMAW